MKVVGLDLSLTGTGIAYVDGTIATLKTALRGLERLAWIVATVTDTVEPGAADVDLVVIEDVAPVRANAIAQLAMLHGAVRLTLHKRGVPMAFVPPATLKKYATGRGVATKPDMRMALYKRVGIDLADDNQVDAWWLRAAGLDHLGTPVIDMPATHRDALKKVEWP